MFHRRGSYAVELGAFGQDSAGDCGRGPLRVTAYGPRAVHCQVLTRPCSSTPRCCGCAATARPGGGQQPVRAVLHPRGGAGFGHSGQLRPRPRGRLEQPGRRGPAVTELGDGDYLVSFPGAGTAGGHTFASIMGTPPMFCNIHSWTVIGGRR